MGLPVLSKHQSSMGTLKINVYTPFFCPLFDCSVSTSVYPFMLRVKDLKKIWSSCLGSAVDNQSMADHEK